MFSKHYFSDIGSIGLDKFIRFLYIEDNFLKKIDMKS